MPSTVVIGGRVSKEVQAAVLELAKRENATVGDIVREAIQAYIGLAKTRHDDLPEVPRESRRILRDAANNPSHPLHDVAYGLLHSPRSLDIAYR